MPGFSGLSNQRRDLRNRLAPGFESPLVLGFTAIVERLLRGVSVLACFDMSVWTGSSDVSMSTVGVRCSRRRMLAAAEGRDAASNQAGRSQAA